MNRTGILEGDDSGEREVEVQIERARSEGAIFAEAVNDAPYLSRPLPLQNREGVLGRRAGVNDDRLSHFARDCDESREDFTLLVPGRVIVMIVEAHFADGTHLRLASESA